MAGPGKRHIRGPSSIVGLVLTRGEMGKRTRVGGVDDVAFSYEPGKSPVIERIPW